MGRWRKSSGWYEKYNYRRTPPKRSRPKDPRLEDFICVDMVQKMKNLEPDYGETTKYIRGRGGGGVGWCRVKDIS